MKKASIKDKPQILQMLESSFQDVPGVNWIIGKGPNQKRKLRRLLEFSLDMTFHQGEVWISDDHQAAMLLFRWHHRKPSLYSIWLQCKLAILVIGITRMPEIIARERFIQGKRPQKIPFLYCWFIATNAQRNSFESIKDIKDGLFLISAKENLPIYMETTVLKNMPAYERYGFETYYRWDRPHRNLSVWFLRREPAPREAIQKHNHFISAPAFT